MCLVLHLLACDSFRGNITRAFASEFVIFVKVVDLRVHLLRGVEICLVVPKRKVSAVPDDSGVILFELNHVYGRADRLKAPRAETLALLHWQVEHLDYVAVLADLV